jgi:putative DNA primase/helicase
MALPPEHNRQERFAAYAAHLQERFNAGILTELQGLPQWVVWRNETDREGKPKKAPYNPNANHAYASVKVPATWGTLDQALSALATGRYSGIGFMTTPPLVFLDLDHCVSKETGEITDQRAAEIVTAVNSYTEVSPSGTGLHVLMFGQLPGKNIHTDIELYGSDRFTTITTKHIAITPRTIEHRQDEINDLYSRFAPPSLSPPLSQNTRGGETSNQHLAELPKEAARDQLLQRLLHGDMSGFASQSSADFVLIMKLLHWTGDDIALTRRLFLESPLGKREKAERPTGETSYVDMTINNVLRKRRNPPMRR